MKKTLKIVSVYTGMAIGAGFASGREIMEYFNFRSNTNMCGVLLAAFLFMLVAYLILSKAAEDNLNRFDSYIESAAGRAAPAVKGFMLTFMFCGLFVMFAGSSALVSALTPLPDISGALIMAALCFIILSFDLKGLVALNTVLTPVMICGIIYVSVCAAVFGEAAAFAPSEYAGGGIMLSAVCYAAYNTVTAGSVLVPLAQGANIREIRRGAVGSGFIIGLLIMLVWTVQGLNFDTLWDSELPMLELAALCGKTCKRVYTAVLFMAICTTAVSYGFGLMSHFADRIKTKGRRLLLAAVICIAALPPAMYGFSNLVAQLYSIFGYIGMIWIVWIAVDRAR